MGAGMVEYWIERLIFKNAAWKGYNILSGIGNVILVIYLFNFNLIH